MSNVVPVIRDGSSGPWNLGSWQEIAHAPVGLYTPEGAFWIDGQLVVVAGSTVQAWDPKRDHWKVVAPQAEECEGCEELTKNG